jgi:hypothetical protein
MSMKKKLSKVFILFICGFFVCCHCHCQNFKLRVIFIRHAEKTSQGDNLTCAGLNRSLLLPHVIVSKFGVPDYTYVPSLGLGEYTSRGRMFQTVSPLAIKYNLAINSKYNEDDATGIASDIMQKKGTVLVVWEHHEIISIVEALGIHNQDLIWNHNDFDSIWIITFDKNGKATFTEDTEGIRPSSNCSY